MPRLTPTDLELTEKIISAGINDGPKVLATSDLNASLVKHDLTTDHALETLSSIMHFSKRENNKIAVARLALEMNGVLKNDESVESAPNIQFIFNDSDVNLNGIFNPKRS